MHPRPRRRPGHLHQSHRPGAHRHPGPHPLIPLHQHFLERSVMNTTRTAVAAAGAGALLVGALPTLASSCTPATAAPPALAAAAATSTATGISVSGGEHLTARPSVSSSGAIKTAGGSVSTPSGAVVASGISLQADAGVAEARGASVRGGGAPGGAVSARR